MKVLLLVFCLAGCAGCAVDGQGNRENPWEAMKRADDSMNTTIERLQDRAY